MVPSAKRSYPLLARTRAQGWILIWNRLVAVIKEGGVDFFSLNSCMVCDAWHMEARNAHGVMHTQYMYALDNNARQEPLYALTIHAMLCVR